MSGLCILAFGALSVANLQFNASFLGVDTTPVIQRNVETEIWGSGATPGSTFVVAIDGVNVTSGQAKDGTRLNERNYQSYIIRTTICEEIYTLQPFL